MVRFFAIGYCHVALPLILCSTPLRSDDGLSFVIEDIMTFQNEFVPRYFNHQKMSSFVRQLNLYGFRKVKWDDLTEHGVAFHHPYFQRDRPDLLRCIRKGGAPPRTAAGVEDLRQEVERLQRQLDNTRSELRGLQSIVQRILPQPVSEAPSIGSPLTTCEPSGGLSGLRPELWSVGPNYVDLPIEEELCLS
jgi:hypothetical protein